MLSVFIVPLSDLEVFWVVCCLALPSRLIERRFCHYFVYIISGVDHDELVKLAETHFSGLRSTYEEQDKVEPCRFSGSEVVCNANRYD